MSNINDSIYAIRILDDLSHCDTSIHKIHPIAKIITTVLYLIFVISFDKYEISGLMPFFLFPVLIFILAEIPFLPIFKRILLVLPFIVGVGIANPFFETQQISFGDIEISIGWLTFLSIFIKGLLTVTASILLLATTGMDKIATSLIFLKVPRIFVLQLLLTYRYISVLMEETSRMMMAYSLRAPGQKGIAIKVWGSFAGQLLLRTFDRAQRVYQSMLLRGFDGEFHMGELPKTDKWKNFAFISIWSLFFILARIYNIPELIGIFIQGGF